MTTAGTFAEHLTALRLRRGMSQYQLALVSGMNHGTISKLCSGKRPNPHRVTVLCLADALRATDAERGHLLFAAGYWPDCPHVALTIARWEVDQQAAAASA